MENHIPALYPCCIPANTDTDTSSEKNNCSGTWEGFFSRNIINPYLFESPFQKVQKEKKYEDDDSLLYA